MADAHEPDEACSLRSKELRSLAKQLNADVYRLNRELRTLIETSSRTRDVLFSMAKVKRTEEERALRGSTCLATTRNGAPCRRNPLELGGYCPTHSAPSGKEPRA